MPLSNFPSIAGICRKAISATREGAPIYTDEQIAGALKRMARDNRAVTADSLRVELDGLPPSRYGGAVANGASKTDAAVVANRARFKAMKAAAQHQSVLAIGGAT